MHHRHPVAPRHTPRQKPPRLFDEGPDKTDETDDSEDFEPLPPVAK